MNREDDAQMVRRLEIERESFKRMREHAKETLDKMIANGEAEPRIRRQKMMIMELSNSITRLGDRIFAAKQRIDMAKQSEDTTPEGRTGI